MTQHTRMSSIYILTYDPENRLVGVSGAATATFVYDGDGKRVKATIGGTTTVYIGDYSEWTGSTSTMVKYIYAGNQRVAMRVGNGTTRYFLLSDHLGSTTVTANSSGAFYAELRYKAWGENRYSSGTTPTILRYTGQRQESYINLYWFGSRWYDDYIAHFIQPDPIVPGLGEGGNPNAVGYCGTSTYSPLIVDFHENQFLEQVNGENRRKLKDPEFRLPPIPTNSNAFDRYAYSLNNPLRYTDPSGHCPFCAVLALVTPVGWAAIGVTAAAVFVYFAVPGVREAVTEGLYNAGMTASNGINSLFAGRYSDDPRTAGEIIGSEKQGKIRAEFPSEWLDKTYDEIKKAADAGVKSAQTAKKLLDRKEYDKTKKK